MRDRIVVFGSFVVDLMARSPHLPVPGETVKGSVFRYGPGGKGFNQGVAAHKAGADVIVSTKLGRDFFAQVALDVMDELSMNKSNIFYSDAVDTGSALILVDETTGQNEIVVVPGACATISEDDIETLKPAILNSKYLLAQLEINMDALEKVVNIAYEHQVKVVLNTAPIQPVSDELLSKVDYITPNEVEAESLTGVKIVGLHEAQKAAACFFEKGVKNTIITLGENGVFVSDGTESRIISPPRVEAVDTTGAGDAFNGGFVAALAEGRDIFTAAKFANSVAALSVQKMGTTPSMPSRDDIDRLFEETYGGEVK
jgi:ribokinase